MGRHRSAFSHEYEFMMWEFLVRSLRRHRKEALQPAGLKIWEMFNEECQVEEEKKRTPSAIASHFRKAMLPNIHKLGFVKEDILLMCRRWRIRPQAEFYMYIEKRFNCKVELDDKYAITDFVDLNSQTMIEVMEDPRGTECDEDESVDWDRLRRRGSSCKKLREVVRESAEKDNLRAEGFSSDDEVFRPKRRKIYAKRRLRVNPAVGSATRKVSSTRMDDDGVVFTQRSAGSLCEYRPVLEELENEELTKDLLQAIIQQESTTAGLAESSVRKHIERYLAPLLDGHVRTIGQMVDVAPSSASDNNKIRFVLRNLENSKVCMASRIKAATAIRAQAHPQSDVLAETAVRMFTSVEGDVARFAQNDEAYTATMNTMLTVFRENSSPIPEM